MARTARKYPKPVLSLRADSYRIRWRIREKIFEITLGPVSRIEAEGLCSMASAALAERIDWPPELATAQSVILYNAQKNNLPKVDTDDKRLIASYIQHLRTNSDSTWPSTVKYMMDKASNFIGGMKDARSVQLNAFLDSVRESTTAATRNRTRAALSGFYMWLRKNGVHPKSYNPMEDIPALPEERPEEGIIVWDQKDIPALLAAADEYADGIAIWIAVYAGLRRSEIARLLWEDVTPAYIVIRKSKTGKQRQVPLSTALEKRLANTKKSGPRIVSWPVAYYGWDAAADSLIKEKLPNALPMQHKENPAAFNWNPLRHTFASRHAQAGHSLDLIAGWLGDSPKVCRDHYARFVPKNRRDERIDLPDLPAPKPPRKPRAPGKTATKMRKVTAKRSKTATGKHGAKKATSAA